MFPTNVGELVVATVPSEAKSLEHVLTGAAIERRRGADVLGFTSGRDGANSLRAETAALIDPAFGVEPSLGETRVLRVIAEHDLQLGYRGCPHSLSRESIPDI
jgi:hypothetical protein